MRLCGASRRFCGAGDRHSIAINSTAGRRCARSAGDCLLSEYRRISVSEPIFVGLCSGVVVGIPLRASRRPTLDRSPYGTSAVRDGAYDACAAQSHNDYAVSVYKSMYIYRDIVFDDESF